MMDVVDGSVELAQSRVTSLRPSGSRLGWASNPRSAAGGSAIAEIFETPAPGLPLSMVKTAKEYSTPAVRSLAVVVVAVPEYTSTPAAGEDGATAPVAIRTA